MIGRALACILVGIGLLVLFGTHARRNYLRCYTGGGDSPHYLMMAKSLARDGDLRLTVAERSLDGNFEDFPLQLDTRVFSEERPYSRHPVGAPILFAPAYAVAGRQGVLFEIAFLATLTAVGLWFYLLQVTQDGVASGLAALAVVLAVPFIPLAANEYTEMPALYIQVFGLAVAAGIRGGPADRVRLLLLGLAVGALPWIHVRYLPVAVALAVVALVRAEPRWMLRAWLLAPAAALVVGLYAWGWHVRGEFALTLPFVLSGGNQASGLSAGVLLRQGLIGHLTDQQGGLLVHAPHLAFAVLGAGEVWRRWRGEAYLHLGYAVPTLLVVASYYNWSGHWGVPCRFLAVLLPGLALALVPVARAALDRGAMGLVAVAPPLVWSLTVSGAMLVWPPLQLSMEGPNVNLGASFVYLWTQTGVPLLLALPRFIYQPAARDYALALAILVTIGAGLRVSGRLLARGPVVRPLALFVAALGVWAGTAAWTRPPGSPIAEDPRWAVQDVEYLLTYPMYYEILAHKAMQRVRPEIARRCVERILEVRPNYAPAYAQMASVVMPVRQDEARLWAQRGLQVIDDPAVPERLFWRGFLHFLAGHGSEARADFIEYLKQPGPQAPVARRLVQELDSAPGIGR